MINEKEKLKTAIEVMDCLIDNMELFYKEPEMKRLSIINCYEAKMLIRKRLESIK